MEALVATFKWDEHVSMLLYSLALLATLSVVRVPIAPNFAPLSAPLCCKPDLGISVHCGVVAGGGRHYRERGMQPIGTRATVLRHSNEDVKAVTNECSNMLKEAGEMAKQVAATASAAKNKLLRQLRASWQRHRLLPL
ncbi:hypothetical protein AMAG_19780 [Allomyces macrogynus ATCC 38327]|uniref:Uncharacterized protein n=1 Tax=Allomyces macrogynus (strain ATCC 38327) TaxID=578462 RepID=A0A0L0T0M0_ALLM3|nr:hypothetical protein AMAG_19780 [Allomyces macrogynus ATCC 38327]|eukprot:KNE68195.1 hypothetical protein AMAG_19780 [Allomyces macrogynus ATCC 38327]